MASSKVVRAISAFERAVIDKALLDSEQFQRLEKQDAEIVLLAFEHNYVKARAKLERLMENV